MSKYTYDYVTLIYILIWKINLEVSDRNERIQVLFHMIIKYICVYFTTSIKCVMLFVRNCGGGREIYVKKKKDWLITSSQITCVKFNSY